MTELVRAKNAEQVRNLIVWANAETKSVSARGAGSKSSFGAPIQPDAILDLSGASSIIGYEPSELVLTVQAGTPVQTIEELLDAEGQQLAFEPPDYAALNDVAPGFTTIGGVIAGNLSGPRRLKDGAARDHFLGFEAVSGRGEIFRAGGKVVKNVTGYDLPKLLAGSWGTLAVLMEVTVKVMPKPQMLASLVFTGLSDQGAAQLMSRALGSPAEISGAAHLPATLSLPVEAGPYIGTAATILRLEGFPPSVEARLELLRRLFPDTAVQVLEDIESKQLWRSIRDVIPFASKLGTLWRLSVAPAEGWRVVDTLRREIAVEAFYDWGGGLVWLRPEDGDVHDIAIRRIAVAAGGHATLMRATAEQRSAVPMFQPEPSALAGLTQRVRTSFDPNGILNRGRFNLGLAS